MEPMLGGKADLHVAAKTPIKKIKSIVACKLSEPQIESDFCIMKLYNNPRGSIKIRAPSGIGPVTDCTPKKKRL